MALCQGVNWIHPHLIKQSDGIKLIIINNVAFVSYRPEFKIPYLNQLIK